MLQIERRKKMDKTKPAKKAKKTKKTEEPRPAVPSVKREEVWEAEEIYILMHSWQQAFGTQRECAEIIGVSAGYWGYCLRGNALPGPKILSGMGIKRRWRYTPE